MAITIEKLVERISAEQERIKIRRGRYYQLTKKRGKSTREKDSITPTFKSCFAGFKDDFEVQTHGNGKFSVLLYRRDEQRRIYNDGTDTGWITFDLHDD